MNKKKYIFALLAMLTLAGSAEAQIFNTNNESKDARTLTGHFEWGGQNANTRAILEAMCQDKIDKLTRENETLRLRASQEAQNAYLINALRPIPYPSFTVANPYAPVTPAAGAAA